MLKTNRKRSSREQADPTRRAATRRQASAALKRKLSSIEKQVRFLFSNIKYQARREQTIVNQETVYDYEYTESDANALLAGILFISNTQLLDNQNGNPPPNWYYYPYSETPYRAGALDENRDFNTLIAGAAAAGVLVGEFPPRPIPPEQLLFSQTYRKSLSETVAENANAIRGLSEDTTNKVFRQINIGIQSNKSPKQIAKKIAERYGVAKSSAERIARSEVNWAYNRARMETSKIMAGETGLRAGVLHISALLPTTRTHHAARHGLAFTPEQQTAWWNDGANRINCYCSVRPVLIGADNRIVDAEFQETIRQERSFFDSES